MKKLLSFVAVALIMVTVACMASKDEQTVADCNDAQVKGDYAKIQSLMANFTESAEGYYFKATVSLILVTNPNATPEEKIELFTQAKELFEKSVATDKNKVAAIEKKYSAKPTAEMITGCQAGIEALQAQIEAANIPAEEQPAEGEEVESTEEEAE